MTPFVLAVLLAANTGPQFAPYQPLVAGMRWNYVCDGGITATRTIATGSIQALSGFLNTITLNIIGQPALQYGELQTNDSQGTRIGGFTFPPTYPGIPIDPPQVELPINPVIGQSVQFPDGAGGVVTVTYQGVATLTVPAGTYTAGVFKEVDSNAQPPIPFPRIEYMVRGFGEVASQIAAFPSQNLPATTCQLQSSG